MVPHRRWPGTLRRLSTGIIVDMPAAGRGAPIRIVNLRKAYRQGQDSRQVLAGLSFEFPAGRLTAIRGRSGSGKTTLLNLLAGLDAPDAGEIYYGARLLTAMDDQQRTLFRRSEIGFIFQFFNLIPTLTVLENVRLPLDLAGRYPAGIGSRPVELLNAVGLAERAAEPPDRLSGGEQQRVAIARALVHRPGLILADEPTGNLDRTTGEQILQLLIGLSAEQGVTLIMATHSHRIAAQADCVLTIEDGRLVPEHHLAPGR
jgi:putative ABC transport system ATP-binding protein